MRIEYVKYKTGKDYILEGHLVEISPGKFISVMFGEGIHLIEKKDIIERRGCSINSQGGWKYD